MGQITHDISNPNDGLGDELRTAFDHQNDMNTELYDTKVDKVLGKDLSSNDFDNAAVVKLAGIEAGAQVNVPINWNDIIGAPEELFASVGYFDHNDLATHTTALSYTSGVELQLTNDTLGDYTDISQAPYGVVDVWDAATNTFDFSALDIGDTLDLRVDLNVSTLTSNSTVKCFLRIAEGTANEFDVFIGSEYYKNAVTFENLKLEVGFYIGNLDVKNTPAKLIFLSTDTNGEVEVNGWYTRIIRKDVNFVSGGTTEFIDLTDTPATYTGQAGKVAAVNVGETALEFIDVAASGELGKIRIVDKLGELFTDLATASAYVSSFTLAAITNESFSDGVYYFTVPNGTSFGEATEFLGDATVPNSAYIEDNLGLINAFGASAFRFCSGNNILRNCTFGANSFQNSTGNNILGDCTFGASCFFTSSGNNILRNSTFGDGSFGSASGVNKFKNILLSAPTNLFALSATGRFEIYGNIGTTEAANYTNFFAGSNATIWVDKSKETSNGGALEGDLATAQANGSKLFFGYVPASGGGATAWGDITGTLSDQTDLQNALNDRVQYIVSDGVASSPVTGTIVETIAKTYTLPANSFLSTLNPKYRFYAHKVGTAGTFTVSVYMSNTDDFATGIQTAYYTSTSGIMRGVPIERITQRFIGTNLFTQLSVQSFLTDNILTANGGTSLAIDQSLPIYVWITLQNNNVADSTTIGIVQITD